MNIERKMKIIGIIMVVFGALMIMANLILLITKIH